MQGEERLDKKNVFNYELEGFEWDYAPSLLMYTREVRQACRGYDRHPLTTFVLLASVTETLTLGIRSTP